MRIALPTLLAVFIFCALPAARAAGEEVANPAYDAWSKFKPGATTRVAGSTKTMGMETTLEINTKLLEVAADKVTLEVSASITMNGNKMDQPAQKQEVKAKVQKEDIPAPAGEEQITVDGKTYNCKVYALTRTQEGTTISAKSWMSDEVPGGVVRVESRTEGAVVSDTRFELKEYSAG